MKGQAMIYYQSVIGNTRAFVQKSGIEACELTDLNYDQIKVDQPFILVAPTYDPSTTAILNDFLKEAGNWEYCRGIFGAGNRNFMDLFCYTAKNLASEFDLPLLHLFEFQGSDYDVNQLVKEHNARCQNVK